MTKSSMEVTRRDEKKSNMGFFVDQKYKELQKMLIYRNKAFFLVVRVINCSLDVDGILIVGE